SISATARSASAMTHPLSLLHLLPRRDERPPHPRPLTPPATVAQALHREPHRLAAVWTVPFREALALGRERISVRVHVPTPTPSQSAQYRSVGLPVDSPQ